MMTLARYAQGNIQCIQHAVSEWHAVAIPWDWALLHGEAESSSVQPLLLLLQRDICKSMHSGLAPSAGCRPIRACMITKPVGRRGCGGKRGGVVCKQCVHACVRVCVCACACACWAGRGSWALTGGKWGNHRIDEGSLHTEHMQGNVLAYNKPG